MVASPTFNCDEVYHVSTGTRPPSSSFFSLFFFHPYICGRGRRPGDEATVTVKKFRIDYTFLISAYIVLLCQKCTDLSQCSSCT